VRALWEAQDKIFPEKQTKARLVRVANRLASEHEVKRTDAVKEVSNLKLPVQKKYFRIEYVPLFRASPVFALRKIRVPRIVLRDKARKWGKISSKVSLVKPLAGKSLSIAIQRRKLFPKAPKWNPVSKLSFPAVRIRKDATRLKPVAKVLKPEEREQKRRLRH
jgi:hypothetical protein